MIRKLIKIFEVLFIYWFVGSSYEMDVNFVSATPLFNGIFNLKIDISKYTLQISLKYKRQLEWQAGSKGRVGKWRKQIRISDSRAELLLANQTWFMMRWMILFSYRPLFG